MEVPVLKPCPTPLIGMQTPNKWSLGTSLLSA